MARKLSSGSGGTGPEGPSSPRVEASAVDFSGLSSAERFRLIERLRASPDPTDGPLAAAARATELDDAALRASELRYRRLFESAQDGILILDAETSCVEC